MDHRHGLNRQRSGLWRTFSDGDFEEEDVWDVINDRNDSSSKSDKSSMESTVSVPRNLPTAVRMIPRASSSSNSSGSNSSHEARVVQQSAPLHVPDWSKIRKKSEKTSKNASWHYDDDDDDDDGVVDDGGDSDDEDGHDAKLPPHEFIARRLARSQISSFSVFEGVGRTLKGRDLSKVRNVVLTKTGFLES